MKFPILMGLFRAAEEQGVDLSDVDVPVEADAEAPAPAAPTSELAEVLKRVEALEAENRRLARGHAASLDAFDNEARAYADAFRETLGPAACDALCSLVLQARLDDQAEDAGRVAAVKAFVSALPKADLTGERVAAGEHVVPPAGDVSDAEAKEMEELSKSAKALIAEANARAAGA